MQSTTIYIGTDHRGFKLKEQLKSWLLGLAYEVVDLGNTRYDPADDYPDFAFAVGEAVAKAETDLAASGSTATLVRGIVICGSGVGANIAVNKVSGVRASLVETVTGVVQGRSDDDLNIISLPADLIDLAQAKKIVQSFLETKYNNEERHARRLQKIAAYEERQH